MSGDISEGEISGGNVLKTGTNPHSHDVTNAHKQHERNSH